MVKPRSLPSLEHVADRELAVKPSNRRLAGLRTHLVFFMLGLLLILIWKSGTPSTSRKIPGVRCVMEHLCLDGMCFLIVFFCNGPHGGRAVQLPQNRRQPAGKSLTSAC